VHIQHLGFPIANDPIYCCKHSAFTATQSAIVGGQVNREDVKIELAKRDEIIAELKKRDPNESEYYEDDEKACIGCLHPKRDPSSEELEIYLHAYKYEGPGWSFEIKEEDRPVWTRVDFDDSFLEERFWRHGGIWDGQFCGEYGPPPAAKELIQKQEE
jgi:tRNA pseudouridine synthase 9